MKTKSKALLLMLCAVLLVAASVLGTMAYLTSTDVVNNTFTVGKVELKLDEAKVDANGDAITSEARVKENAYKLLPGHEYDKDPTIHVDANSEDCYLFVIVNNGIADIEDADTTVAAQMAVNGWKVVNEDEGLYVYAKGADKAVVSASEDVVVFEKIKVAGSVDNTTLATYENATISVNAYAVQKDGFEASTPEQIWAATFGA